jgi:hypothetical protein
MHDPINGGVAIIHVIPLENEIDRAVRPFEVQNGFKANRVYLLAFVPDEKCNEETDTMSFYREEVKRRLEARGIEVVVVKTDIMDMLDVITKVSEAVRSERAKGNTVYVNMSAGGAFVSVGTAISAMVQDARLYYVRCERYTNTPEEKRAHGNAIATKFQIHFLENFKIRLPDERGLTLLVELYARGKMRTNEVLEFMHKRGVEGFGDDPTKLSREEKITLLMRLNKGVTWKLEEAGYIAIEKRGRENIYTITESGKYAACVSGLASTGAKPF